MNRNFNVYLKTHLDSDYVMLDYEPVGMADYKNRLVRHELYKTVLVDITFDIRFVKDGRDRIKAAFDDLGINATCLIRIDELNTETNGYVTIFEGVGDFTYYQEEEIEVKIPFESNSVLMTLRNRASVGISSLNTQTIDGITLIPPTPTNFTLPKITEDNILNADSMVANTSILNKDIHETGTVDAVVSFNIPINQTGNWDGVIDGEGVLTVNTTVVADTTVKLEISTGTGHMASGTIYIEINRSIAGVRHQIYSTNSAFYLNQSDKIDYFDIDCVIAESNTTTVTPIISGIYYETKVTVVTDAIIGDLNLTGEAYGINNLFLHEYESLYSKTIYNQKNINIVGLYDMFSHVYKSLTNLDIDLEYIDNDAILSDIDLYTPTGNIILSFEKLFKSVYAIKPIGLKYDSQSGFFKIIGVDEIYEDIEIANINAVDLTTSVYRDILYNGIEYGYESSINPSSISQYDCNIRESNFSKYGKNNVKYTAISQLRADNASIYRAAYEYNNMTAKELERVNEPLIITSVTKSDTNATGISSVEWLNTSITPIRNIHRHLHLFEYVPHFESITETSTNEITTTYEGLTLTERMPIEGEYDSTIFEPILYEFDAYLSHEQRQAIKANPNGYITFNYEGVEYKGYIQEADINNNKNKAHFKLIKKYVE